MTTRQRSVRSLNTRSASGAIGVAEAKFSTGWSSATGTLISDDILVETALKLISTKLVRGDRLESPRATRQYLSLRFASLEHEVFCCLWLDNRHRVIACDELFRGTIDGASVHPPGGGQASAGAERRGGHSGAQPPVRRGRAQPGG